MKGIHQDEPRYWIVDPPPPPEFFVMFPVEERQEMYERLTRPRWTDRQVEMMFTGQEA